MYLKQEKADFLDKLYSGEELVFTYKNRTLFTQGYYENDFYHMDFQEWKPIQKTIWAMSAKTMEECAEAFLYARLFDGKCFWNVEKDISWIDG